MSPKPARGTLNHLDVTLWWCTAGTDEFAVIATSFDLAVRSVFKRYNATTSEDLPKPFALRVHDGDVMVV